VRAKLVFNVLVREKVGQRAAGKPLGLWRLVVDFGHEWVQLVHGWQNLSMLVDGEEAHLRGSGRLQNNF